MSVAMLFFITGCSPKIQGENLMKDVQTDDVPGTLDLSVDSASLTDFAVRLFQASIEEGENTVV